MKTLIISLLGAASAAPLLAQNYSPVAILVSVADYVDDVYTERPRDGATHVLFQGESVRLNVALVNQGRVPQTLHASDTRDERFHVSATRGGLAVPVRVRSADAVRVVAQAGTNTLAIAQLETTALEPGGWASVGLDVSEGIDQPGVYAIGLDTSLVDSAGRRVLPQRSIVRLEVRARTADDRCEVARRAALRAFFAGDDPAALGFIVEMLAADPQNHLAHAMRGDVESRRGNPAAAARHYALALEQLPGDARLRRRAVDVDQAAAGLLGRLRAEERRQK